jgi:hypothetical protein
MACPPPPEYCKNISTKSTEDESEKPSTRPQSSTRDVLIQRRNIFTEKEKDTSKDSRMNSRNNVAMLMSQRDTSPFNTEKVATNSRNDARSSHRTNMSNKRTGSAINRCMSRNLTEKYLLSTKDCLENKKEPQASAMQSQYSKYSQKGR